MFDHKKTAIGDVAPGKRGRASRHDLGSALLVVMAAAAILFVTAAAVVGIVVFQQTQQARAQAVVRSTALAQQGMEVYLTALRTNPDFWVTTPTIAGQGQDGTWTVAARIDTTSSVKTITSVGHDRRSGVLHVIRAEMQDESWSDYTIVSDDSITLGNGNGTLTLSGDVRSNGRVILAQNFPSVTPYSANPGSSDEVEVVAPLSFDRIADVFPNLYTAASRRDTWATGASTGQGGISDYLTGPLAFFRDRSNSSRSYWGASDEAGLPASVNATGLVGVGVDFSHASDPGTGVFYIRSMWTPPIGATAAMRALNSVDVTTGAFTSFARQNPVWNIGQMYDPWMADRPLSITPAGLNPNGNNVIYVGGNLDVYVSGEYFRSVTIVSERDIYVIGEIKRSTSASADPSATVGLVAKGNIYIAAGMPDKTESAVYQTVDGSTNGFSTKSYTRGNNSLQAYGEVMPNNVTVQASMMAVDGAIIMDPEVPEDLPSGLRPATRTGTLTIKGSLIARQGLKGPNFANETSPYGGFNHTVIGYDPMLSASPPPLFPKIGQGALKVVRWDEYTTDVDPNAGLTFPPPGQYGPTGPTVDEGNDNPDFVDPPSGPDNTPPVTVDNHADAQVYYGQAVITLDVSDAGNQSPIYRTWWMIDGDPQKHIGTTIEIPPLADNTMAWRTLSYWSQDMAGEMEDTQTITFLMRGRDTIPAQTTVIDSQNPEKELKDGFPQADEAPYVVYGEFQPLFTAVDTTEGLGVEQIWTIRDGHIVESGNGSSIETRTMSVEPPTAGFVDLDYVYYSIDKAGNREPDRRLTVRQHAFDRLAPIVYHDAPSSLRYHGDAELHLTAIDDEQGQGVRDISYSVAEINDGRTVTSVNATTSLSMVTTIALPADPDGTHDVTYTITYSATDLATTYGREPLPNHSTVETLTVVVGQPLNDDETPPVTTSDAKDSYVGPATILLSAVDTSGVSATYWRLNGGETHTGSRVDIAASPTTTDVYTLEFWSVDSSPRHNKETNKTVSFTVSPEQIAPITVSHNFNLYSSASAVFQLEAEDNPGGSGLARTLYRIDGGAWVTNELGLLETKTAVTVTDDGLHTVDFYSVDRAGNAEAIKSTQLRIDTTAPRTTSDALTTTYSGQAAVTLTALDDGAGVAYTHWRNAADGIEQISNPVLLGPGSWDIDFWSVDKAGNAEMPTSIHINVVAAPDHTAPDSYDDVVPVYKKGTNPPAVIKLYSWDVQSGVKTMNYALDGVVSSFAGKANPPAFYQLTATGEGTHTLTYAAVDNAGNAEETRTVAFKIDTIAPLTKCDARTGATYWRTMEFKLLSADSGTGVKATYYTLDGGATIKADSVKVPAPLDGSARPHVIQFWSIDNAGNVETPQTVSFTSRPTDITPPTTSAEEHQYDPSTLDVTLIATDRFPGSGVAYTKYKLDSGEETTGTEIRIDTPGPHDLEFWSYDNAGNQELPHKVVRYVVDGLPPTTISDARALYNAPATINMTATDNADGDDVAFTYYILDGGAKVTGTPPVTHLSVTTTGTHRLEFWSVDQAGNVEATNTATFLIDMKAPVTTSAIQSAYFGPADISFVANDEVGGSGIAKTYYKLDGSGRVEGTALTVNPPVAGAPATHTISYWSTDLAGNSETQHDVTFTVAPIAPMTFSAQTPTDNITIAVRNPKVSVIGHSTTSSTLTSATATIDGKTVPVTLTYDGGYTKVEGYWVEGYWVDGHWEDDGCDTWWVDAYYVPAYYVDTTHYVPIDYTTMKAEFSAAGLLNGKHTVIFTFTNSLTQANFSKWSFTVTAPADVTAPVTTATVLPIYSASTTLTLSAVDETGGTEVANTFYKLDDGPQQSGTPPVTLIPMSAEGSHKIEFWSVDYANNSETPHITKTFIIDKTAPVTTGGAASSYEGTATVWLSAIDSGSGVKTTTYTVDGGASITASTATIQPGVVGQWHLDAGTGTAIADASSNGYTGTLTVGSGGTQTTVAAAWAAGATGKYSKAMSFDGTDDKIVLGSQTALNNLADSFSVAAWVKTSVNAGTHTIASRGNDWILRKTGGNYVFEHRNAANGIVTATAANSSTDWVYVVGTFDKDTGQVKLYLNGVLADSRAQTGTTRKGQTMTEIGSDYAWHADTTYDDYFWSGLIDEVTISDVARPATDIQSYYAASGSLLPPYPVTITAPVSGPPVTHNVAFRSVDNAGNAETQKNASISVSIRADTIPPTTTSNAVATYTKPTTISLSATDNVGGWGVSYTRFQLDATSGVWTTGTAATTGMNVGSHTLYFYSVDAAGNVETPIKSATFTLQGDTTPPVTTHNALSLYEGANTITLSATDVGWGVDKTYYSVDGGAFAAGTSVAVTAPPTLAPVAHTLRFYSTDLAGLKEDTKSVTYSATGVPASMVYTGVSPVENSSIKILNPTVTVTGKSTENITGFTATLDGVAQAGATISYPGGYYEDHGTWTYDWVSDGCDTWQEWVYHPDLVWIAADLTQGTVTFPTTALPNGPHTVSVTYNLASTNQGRKTWTFIVDQLAPTTSSDAKASYAGTATIQLSAADNVGGSGIKWTHYRVDTGADTSGTTIVIAPPAFGETSHTVYFWSSDNTDNVETPAKYATFTQSANPDTIPPTTTSNAATYYPAASKITLYPTDNVGGWGVANTYSKLDTDGPVVAGTLADTGSGGGHTLYYWSVDRAGNKETTRSATYTVASDVTPPVSTAVVSPSYTGTATISITATDPLPGWGVDRIMYRFDGGTTQTVSAGAATAIASPPATGTVTRTLWYHAADKAGNTETVHQVTFTQISVPPPMTWSAWTPGVNTYNRGVVTTVSVTGQAQQAIATVTATIDGTQRAVSTGYWVEGHYENGSVSVPGYFTGGNQFDGTLRWGPDYMEEGWDDAWTVYANFDLSAYAGATITNASLSWNYDSFGGSNSGPSKYVIRTDNWSVLQYWDMSEAPTALSGSGVTSFVDARKGSTAQFFFGADNGSWDYDQWGIESGMSAPVLTFTTNRWVPGYWAGGSGDPTKATAVVAPIALVDGQHNVSFTYTLASGASSSTAWSFWVDNVSPVTTSSVVTSYTGNAVITLSATDAGGCGVAYTKYSIDGGAWNTYSGAFTVAGPATGSLAHYITFYSVDRATNTEVTKRADFTISANNDVTPPTTTTNIQRWYRTNSTITLTAVDNVGGWGVNRTQYRLYRVNTPNPETLITSATANSLQTGTTEGEYRLEYWSVDNANNKETTRSALFGFDATTPTSWSNAVSSYSMNAPITLSASDNLSGIQYIKYSLDGGALQNYTTTINVAGPAYGTVAHYITFYALDNAGNQETPTKRVDFTIEGVPAAIIWSGWTPPKLSTVVLRNPSVSVRGKTVENISSVTAKLDGVAKTPSVVYPTVTVVDPGYDRYGHYVDSGCSSWWEDLTPGDPNGFWEHVGGGTTVQTDYTDGTATFPTTGLSDGTHTVSFTYTVASGAQTTTVWTFAVSGPDNQAPVTTSTVKASYVGTASISLMATDYPIPGAVGLRGTYYTIDGSAKITGTSLTVAPPVYGAAVSHTLKFWSDDLNNNSETTNTVTFTVAPATDSIPPTTSTNATSTYTGTAVITLSAVDNPGGWGVDKTWYKLDTGAWINGTSVSIAPPTMTSAAHTLYYYSTDRVPNTEITKSVTFTVNAVSDVTSPTTTHNASTVYNAPSTITLTPMDNAGGWGIKYTRYIMVTNGVPGAETTYTAAVPTGSQGSYVLQFYSVDWAGNRETTKTAAYVVDQTKPVTTSNAVSTYTVNAAITLSPSDSHVGASGVRYTYYKIDSGAYTLGTSFNVPGPASGPPVSHTIWFYSIDYANNTEVATSTTFKVTATADTTKPTTTSNRQLFYAGPSTITLTPVDNVGGWGIAGTFYSVDGAATASGTAVPTGGAGQHNVRFWSVDNASNTESATVQTYTVDMTPPTTGSNVATSYTGPATITLTPLDDAIGSGIRGTRYKLDSGAEVTGTVISVPAPSSFSQTHRIDYYSIDNVGNTEVSKSATFTVWAPNDTNPPVSSAGATTTFSKPATITISSTDVGWGLKTINYKLDTAAPVVAYTTASGGVMSASVQLSTTQVGGAHTLLYWATDQYGLSEATKTLSYTVTPDTTKPVTTSNIPAIPGAGPLPISLTATDTGWGVAYTKYSVDDGVITTGTSFTVADTLTGSQVHHIDYWSVDFAGNIEDVKTETFTVKAALAPMSFWNIKPVDGSTVGTSFVPISISASATAQAISSAKLKIDGVERTAAFTASGYNATVTVSPNDIANGAHTIEVIFTAANGRQNSKAWAFTAAYQTDFEAPVTTSNAESSYFSTATIELVATDNSGGSGVAYTKYKVDASAWTTGTLVKVGGPVSGPPEEHTVQFWSADNAGNKETTRSVTFTISPRDTIPPTTTSNAKAYYNAVGTILLSATDNEFGSGVAHTYYRLDGGDTVEGTLIGVAGSGNHVLEFWSVDKKDNIEAVKTIEYKVDTVAPVTTSDAQAYAYDTVAVIHFIGKDEAGGSGIDKTYYKLDGGIDVVSDEVDIPQPKSGYANHTILFWSKDKAGNVEATKSVTVVVNAPNDETPPITTDDHKAVYPVPSRIMLTAVDDGWGVDKTYYILDGGLATAGNQLRTGGAGSHELLYWSVDLGGYKEATHTVNYTVTAADTTPPITDTDAQGSYVGSATITMTPRADDSGVTPVTYFKLDSGAVTTGTVVHVPAPRSGTADHTLQYWSIDYNGQKETTKSASFTVEQLPAHMVISGVYPADGAAVTIRNPAITITAQGSYPIVSCQLELDGANVVPTLSPEANTRSMTYEAGGLKDDTHTVIATFTDTRGASETTTWRFAVRGPNDVQAPVSRTDAKPYYRSAATINIGAFDEIGGSGVLALKYKIDGGPVQTGKIPTETITINAAGARFIEYWAEDVQHNVEVTKRIDFVIDWTAPSSNSDARVAYTGDAVVHMNPTDNLGGSGLAGTYYIVDGGAVASGTVFTVPAPLMGFEWHTVQWWSADRAGNTETTKSISMKVWAVGDEEAPTTIADVVASYPVPSVIHLTASDNAGGSGGVRTFYRLDNGPTIEGTFVGTGGAGTHTIEYWSIDAAGNAETVHSFTYTVAMNDSTAPVTSSNAELTYSGISQISLTATDGVGGSGVASTWYRYDDGPAVNSTVIGVSGDGVHHITFWSVDWAGNTEVAKSATFTVTLPDTTPPVTTSNALASYAGTATVSLTATDTGVGVRTTFYRVDGGAATQGTMIVIAPPASGSPVSHTIAFWSVDKNGITEPENTKTFTVGMPPDSTAPVTNHNGASPYTGPAAIELVPTDNVGGTGVASTWYRLDDGPLTQGVVVNVPAPASGYVDHHIDFYSVDVAGNQEVEKTFSFRVNAAGQAGTAYLSFVWNGSNPAGNASLRILNSSGVTIASQYVSGTGTQLNWYYAVPSGQSYRMVVDSYFDSYLNVSGGPLYEDTGVVTDGLVHTYRY